MVLCRIIIVRTYMYTWYTHSYVHVCSSELPMNQTVKPFQVAVAIDEKNPRQFATGIHHKQVLSHIRKRLSYIINSHTFGIILFLKRIFGFLCTANS